MQPGCGACGPAAGSRQRQAGGDAAAWLRPGTRGAAARPGARPASIRARPDRAAQHGRGLTAARSPAQINRVLSARPALVVSLRARLEVRHPDDGGAFAIIAALRMRFERRHLDHGYALAVVGAALRMGPEIGDPDRSGASAIARRAGFVTGQSAQSGGPRERWACGPHVFDGRRSWARPMGTGGLLGL